MSSYHKEITTTASTEKVVEALTSADGIAGWWSLNSTVGDGSGAMVEMKFDKDGITIPMSFRIDAADVRKVRWTCTDNGNPLWVGTHLEWQVDGAGGDTSVRFEHSGWGEQGVPDQTAAGWEHFMSSLKNYVETGTGQPWA